MKNFKALETAISISMEVENKTVNIPFSSAGLRKWINSIKIKPNQKTVPLKFNFRGKPYVKDIDISVELPTIKRAVKLSELVFDIIPSSLSLYLNDVTQELAQKQGFRAVGREHEIDKSWFYLSQETRNNVFLIGEKDVGKTTIAMEIARRIAINDCPKEFYNKRVVMLNPEQLFKIKIGALYDFKVNQIIEFLAENKDDIILFVDKALLLKTDVGLIKILVNCLKKHNIPLIVTSSTENFENFFLDDQSISKYVNFIEVEEPALIEVEPMLMPHIQKLEKQYGISFPKRIIQYAIYTCDLNPSVSANPGKLINIIERSFLNAKMKDKTSVDKECVLGCYDTQIKLYSSLPEEEKLATAYHETGHYLLTVKSKYLTDMKIACVSTLPMNWWAGVTYSYNDPTEYSVKSREYFLDYIAMTLAGRIAERKFTGLNSTGASADLKDADRCARAMVMDWGLSSDETNTGNRHYDLANAKLLPEWKKEWLEDEIEKIIKEATNRATRIITENEQLLKVIVNHLMVEEILTGEELKKICDEFETNLTDEERQNIGKNLKEMSSRLPKIRQL